MKVKLADLAPPSCIVRPVLPLELEILTDAIAEHGLLTPLVVCNNQIVDGYRRYLVLKGMGETEAEANVVEGDPDQLRIIAQTSGTEVSKKDLKILVSTYLERNPDATAAEIGHHFKWPPVEVEKLVSIDSLCPEARRRYEAGEITLYTAWFLGRVVDKAQLELMEGPLETLHERAEAHLREVKHARRRSYAQRPRVKSYNAIAKELENPLYAGEQLIAADAKTPLDGWKAALRWIISSK